MVRSKGGLFVYYALKDHDVSALRHCVWTPRSRVRWRSRPRKRHLRIGRRSHVEPSLNIDGRIQQASYEPGGNGGRSKQGPGVWIHGSTPKAKLNHDSRRSVIRGACTRSSRTRRRRQNWGLGSCFRARKACRQRPRPFIQTVIRSTVGGRSLDLPYGGAGGRCSSAASGPRQSRRVQTCYAARQVTADRACDVRRFSSRLMGCVRPWLQVIGQPPLVLVAVARKSVPELPHVPVVTQANTFQLRCHALWTSAEIRSRC